MTTVRSAKVKGAMAEYDTWESLKGIYPNILLTKQLGFQMQYDLVDHGSKTVFEVKRLKSMSWNQALQFYRKLASVSLKYYAPYLIFKSNNQPALVMYEFEGRMIVAEFQTVFNVPFIKHISTRSKIEN